MCSLSGSKGGILSPFFFTRWKTKSTRSWAKRGVFFCAELVKLVWLVFCSFLQSASHLWLQSPMHSMARSSSNPFFFSGFFCGGRAKGSTLLMQYVWLLWISRVTHSRRVGATTRYRKVQVPLYKWSRSGLEVLLGQGDDLSQPKLFFINFFCFPIIPSWVLAKCFLFSQLTKK